MAENTEKSEISYQQTVRRRRILITVGIIAALLLIAALYLIFAKYTDYDSISERERTDSAQTQYVEFEGNILSYSLDGVVYSDRDGNVIWNESYEMLHPTVKKGDGYILIYDRQGTLIKPFSAAGAGTTIYTTMPISEADIAANGSVAVLMQEGDKGYLQRYTAGGQISANGELHMASGGYPIDIALSSDGERLAASVMDLVNGEVRAKLIYYDFGKAGEQNDKHIVATVTYANTVMPEIDFVRGDRLLCVCDNGIRIFDNGSTPELSGEILFSGQMKSVIHNDRYIAVIGPRQNEDGFIDEVLQIYNMRGRRLSERVLEGSYQYFYMTDGNEVVISDGQEMSIISVFGVEKFSYTFTDMVYKLLRVNGIREYLLIRAGSAERIRIR